MIEVSGLTKTYGEIAALSDVTFTVKKGDIVGFLGANGAGKTTTMDILCGCIGADRGAAKIAGFDITDEPLEAKRRLGYLPDQPPLHLEMRVEEFVAYAAKVRKIPATEVKSRVDRALESLSITDVRRRVIGNLSKGYRQRVALAQAIVHDPEVLVLDEPTEGLDPTQIAHIRELIRSLAGKHTIILSSHILSEVQNTCDRIIIIHKGRIIQQGTYGELAQSLEGGHVYRVRVASKAEALADSLKGLAGIASARTLEGTSGDVEFVVAKSAGDRIIDDVARTVVDGGFGLRELNLKTKSLEEVFLSITTSAKKA